MQEEIENELIMSGANVAEAIERFAGNQEMFESFLIKFSDDTNYDSYEKELAQKNYLEAFKYAHTFKGVAGNLSLCSLYNAMVPIVESLRKSEAPQMHQVEIARRIYKTNIEIIQKMK